MAATKVAFGSIGIASPPVAPSTVDFYNEKITMIIIVVDQLVTIKYQPIIIKFKVTIQPFFFALFHWSPLTNPRVVCKFITSGTPESV